MSSVWDGYAELALRERDGITVRLLWDAATNDVWLSYLDRREHSQFAARVAAGEALEAFHHPNLFRPGREDDPPPHGTQAPRVGSASPGAMGELGPRLRDRS